MKYQSTRNASLTVDSLQAVLQGMAPDGGLYVPSSLRELDFHWKSVLNMSTQEMAGKILAALLPDFDAMPELVQAAYRGKFETEELTPLVAVGDRYVLELFRGPTSAFKDVALSMLPQLICAAKRQIGDTHTTLILTATSGDTGKAALKGFADVPGVRIVVFYPEKGVSAVQKAQMITQEGCNVNVCAVRGNFDDAQTGVKKAFSACSLKTLPCELSSANSINIGRLAPQVVYYFKAYADLVRCDRIAVGDRVDFVVPTGNFGDILAGYLAKQMGLPVGRLVCASNANNVLTDFLLTGRYDRCRPFFKTVSPSMDILVSSNLERLLYFATGDDAQVAGWMKSLNETCNYTIPPALLAQLQAEFSAGCCDDAQTEQCIAQVYRTHHYLLDTHTAVAWNIADNYMSQGTDTPVVVLSTASPYKFPAAVLKALSPDDVAAAPDEFSMMRRLHELTNVPIPKNLADLAEKAVLHTNVIDTDDITDYVLRQAQVQ